MFFARRSSPFVRGRESKGKNPEITSLSGSGAADRSQLYYDYNLLLYNTAQLKKIRFKVSMLWLVLDRLLSFFAKVGRFAVVRSVGSASTHEYIVYKRRNGSR